MLTYANLLNGMKARDKEKLRAKLQGKSDKQQIEGHEYTSIQVDSKLYSLMPEGSMVTFARQNRISFKICLEYIEYLRGLLKPSLQS